MAHKPANVTGEANLGRGNISIERVSKIYEPFGARVSAVDNCSLSIDAGQFVAIVGPSGCGKTTLLNAIAGFDTITSGAILLDGEVISAQRKQIRPGPDRVVVFQNGALFPWKTMMANIVYGPIKQKKMARREAEKIAIALLKKVGLEGIQDKYPGEVSSGMQRRVEILRALINQPTVMLLDEPFRALDAVAKSVMHRFLLDLFDDSPRTTIFITHDLEEAIFLADKVIVMTTRPARVKVVHEIELPRPRTRAIIGSEHFMRTKRSLLDVVHEEALKAFQSGEREMA
ncbi:MAG: ABC transporter ATP-binding protein [Proteobacteria bacterium]|nr:ABC transporter ATP-binding protein [Pseudomonadota bacterium]